jgi:hypothetical protein
MTFPPLITHLYYRESGLDVTEGPVFVKVRVGKDVLRDGLGTVEHLGYGVWEYRPDEEKELGPWETLVVFTGEGIFTEVRWRSGHDETKPLPSDWTQRETITRTELINLIGGFTPRTDMKQFMDWLIYSYDKIPLTDEIKTNIIRAYPQLIK